MIIADTDVLLDYLAGRDPGAHAVARELRRGGLLTSAVTAFELRSAAHTRKQVNLVERLLGTVLPQPLDDAVMRRAAALRRGLETNGQQLSTAAYLIAATCLELGATLLTGQPEAFEGVPGLRLASLDEASEP